MKGIRLEATNYAAWGLPLHSSESVAAFVDQASWSDGIHIVKLPNGNHLDILLKSDPLNPARQDSVAVFLSGALSNREGKLGPYFSGLRVAQALGIPFIAFSDPSLNLNGELPLGWYAGSQGDHLQDSMTEILQRFTNVSQRHLLLVGGSGGGFASLYFAHRIGGMASAFVWNPQTEIVDYETTTVMKYLDTAIPNHGLSSSQQTWKSQAHSALRALSIDQRLPQLDAGRVFYLQNATDWHVSKHLAPFMARNEFIHRGNGFYANDKNHGVVISHYGEGHAVPSTELIHTIVRKMLPPGRSTRGIFNELIAEEKLPTKFHLLPRDMREEWSKSSESLFGIETNRSAQQLILSVDWRGQRPGTAGVTAILRAYGKSGVQKAGPSREPTLAVTAAEPVRAEAEFTDGFGNHLGSVTASIPGERGPLSFPDETGTAAEGRDPENSQRTPLRIFIYGSCVSRDAFEIPGAPHLVDYRARSSIGSAFGRPTGLANEVDLNLNSSAFQRRMVRTDLNKELDVILKASSFDYLLLDFIDERLQLIRSDSGYDTYSPELSRAGFVPSGHNLVEVGSEEYFSAFEAGWEKLLSVVPADRIVVSKTYWAVTDEGQNKIGDPTIAAKHNAILKRLYSHVLKSPEVRFIEYSEEELTAKANHKWGVSPFHYGDAFYLRTLNSIYEIAKVTARPIPGNLLPQLGDGGDT